MALNEQFWRDVMSGRDESLPAALLRAALTPASWVYGLAARVNAMLFDRRLRKIDSVDVAVISVGNITTGGTGKTPVAAWIVRQLIELGAVPAIVTRGYRSVDGHSDEAGMLARATGAKVYVDPRRLEAARAAVAEGADVIVMDDGFQHRRLHRDLDVVLIDATNPFGYGYVLPRGLLREPVEAISRADVAIVTRCDQVSDQTLTTLRRDIASLGCARVISARVEPVSLRCGGESRDVNNLAGRRVFAFCGLGNPDGFFATLESLGAEIVGRFAYNDHYAYAADDMRRIAQAAERAKAELIVTTAKDAEKTDRLAGGGDVAVLEIDLEFIVPGRLELLTMIKDTCKRKKAARERR